MNDYHKYVFNIKNRKFVGDFDEMYQYEEKENYDSWYSSNTNSLPKKIHFEIIDSYNFNTILDFGCGKGFMTNLLKKENNIVEGWDISSTAIKKANQYFGKKISFSCVSNPVSKIKYKNYDLIVILEALSYIKNWKKLLEVFSRHSSYIYISLYIPENPIGFVKSIEELEHEIKKHYEIVTKILFNEESIFILGKNIED